MSAPGTPRRSSAWLAVKAATALTITFLLAPIAVVLIEAFNDSDLMSFPPQAYSLRWFRAFFDNAEFIGSLLLSLKLGLIAAALSTVAGTMAGLALARGGSSNAGLQTLLLSPLYVPRVLIGLALLLAFAWLNVSGALWGMILGHVLITIPYVVRTVLIGARAVDTSVEEAARMLGATRWQAFRLVTMPLIRAAMLSGFVFALIISFSDIYLALFISGPQTITLPMRLFTFMEWDQSPLVAAASAVQIALILAVIVVTGRLFGLSTPGRVE